MLCPNPNCYSTDINSNHIPESWMHNVARVAEGGHHVHSHFLTFAGMTLWGAMKAVNSVRRVYRCNGCGATFDA